MAKWEEELIDDVNNYTLEYILSGNNYTEISNNVIEQYKHTFTRLMSTIWKDILFLMVLKIMDLDLKLSL